MSDYTEALADTRVRQIEPGLIMRPFHAPDDGQQEWHVYCSADPDFGFCGSEQAATNAALDHGGAHRRAAR